MYRLSPLIGFHGCEKEVAEHVFSGKAHLNPSENGYDWLGSGIYFWVDSYERAIDWARGSSKIQEPYVVGAFIDPGYCLNLTDFGVNSELKTSYESLKALMVKVGQPLPENTITHHDTLMVRKLDCAVINYLHQLREDKNLKQFNTVYGVFEEGNPLFQGSALKEKTHVQIAVRTPDSILGYFRPQQLASF
ncbi:MAG: hypothetical protein IBX50_20320 [Marinospirillum sp.]|nr:hypothetical protein [Marinospirillum sp.]